METNPERDRQEFIDGLSAALNGEKQAHVWRSNLCRWMHIEIVDVGAEVTGPEQPESFVEATNYHYDGIMGVEEIQERLDMMSSYDPAEPAY